MEQCGGAHTLFSKKRRERQSNVCDVKPIIVPANFCHFNLHSPNQSMNLLTIRDFLLLLNIASYS